MPPVRFRGLSVRARLVVLATVSVGVALVAAAAMLVYVQRELMTSRIDEAVLDRAADIGLMIESGQLPAVLTTRRNEESFIQVVDARLNVIATSANLSGEPPVSDVTVKPGEQALVKLGQAPVGDSDSFRMAVGGFATPEGVVTVYVGGSLDTVEKGTGILISALSVGIPVLTVLVGLVSWLLAGRALAPVESIRAEVAEISGASIERRVAVPNSNDEIARLAATMNAMLDRLEDAQRRQARFVSDASHELRSPLTGIVTTLEVGARGGSPGDQSEAIRAALDEAARLARLIEDLLADAEIESGVERPRRAVDLDDIVLEEASSLRRTAGVAIDASGVSGAQVVGYREQLRRAVRNLLDNARRYARSRVLVELRETGGTARLVVSDDGPGIPADQQEAVFDRFARADQGRGRDAGGTGLGLAITRGIALGHGGRVYVDPSYTDGARLVLELPLGERGEG